jgi:hypothetical protein
LASEPLSYTKQPSAENSGMKLDEANIRASSSTKAGIRLSLILLPLLPFCVAIQQTAVAQQQGAMSAGIVRSQRYRLSRDWLG